MATMTANVHVTVNTAEGFSGDAKLTAVRAASLTLVDNESARTELTIVVEDNAQEHHVVRFPAEDIGKVLMTAGVNMYEELPGRLLYLGGDSVIVNPFIYTAVRGSAAPILPPANELEGLEDPHAGHDHG